MPLLPAVLSALLSVDLQNNIHYYVTSREAIFYIKKKGNGLRHMEFTVLIMFPIGRMYLACRGVT